MTAPAASTGPRPVIPAPASSGDARMDPRVQALFLDRTIEPRPDSKYLFWVPGGFDLILEVESAMAVGLKLRGADVHAVICDGTYSACTQREIINPDDPRDKWRNRCAHCRKANAAVLERAGVEYSFVGDYVSSEVRGRLRSLAEAATLENLRKLEYGQARPGRHALSSLIRFLQGRPLEEGRPFVSDYAYSALICAEASANALAAHRPDRMLMSHCTYVDWGPAMFESMASGVPVTGWRGSYLKSHMYMQHFTSPAQLEYCHLSPGAWESAVAAGLDPDQEARLEAFWRDRYERGSAQDVPILPQGRGRQAAFRRRYGITGDKPVWGVLTHILWDAVDENTAKAYPDFHAWLLDTVRAICANDQVHWLIKIHPAESFCNPDDGAEKLICEHFPDLPDHVRIVPYAEDVSLPEFFEVVDGIASVFSTASMEIACQGKPAILAGDCHFSGKGFTHDHLDPESYVRALSMARDIGPLSPQARNLARVYCYNYFIQREIPFPVIFDPDNDYFRFMMDLAGQLAPGDPLSDFLFKAILEQREFILPEALVPEAEKFRELQYRARRDRGRRCA